MRAPICSFDAKTGILCPRCEAKLKSGHISKVDVEASMRLTKLADKVSEVDKVTLMKVHEVGEEYVLVLGAGDLNVLRRDPEIVRRMEGDLQRKVWLIEGGTSDRRMLEDLFFPIRIATVNIVWLPDGSKLTKVVVPGKKTARFPIDINQVKRVTKEVMGLELIVEFER